VERAIKMPLFDFGPAPLCVLTNWATGFFSEYPHTFRNLPVLLVIPTQ
jgi:hypothetical protein